MADGLVQLLRHILPEDLVISLSPHLELLEQAQFQKILEDEPLRKLLGHFEDDTTKEITLEGSRYWSDYIFDRLDILLRKRQQNDDEIVQDTPRYRQYYFFIAGLAALGAFLQSNVTGPPLSFSSAKVLLLQNVASNPKALSRLRQTLIESLGSDGEAAYKLIPNVELFCLADTILTCPPIYKNIQVAKWAKLRVDFLHQRILSEIAPSLEKLIYEGLDFVEKIISTNELSGQNEIRTAFFLESATIHTHHGHDKLATKALDRATETRHFEFALTGLLGKRTKYQRRDVSQLVVLARSAEVGGNGVSENSKKSTESPLESQTTNSGAAEQAVGPNILDLNDDTLLESISFSKTAKSKADVQDESTLPYSLTSLDPENQPILNPLDSIILLSVASSITNTNPANGLTREETLPYATRVLEGGSSNWQVYTQALLLRSRIEGYKSRTVERGLLQLQALVDQVIADTSSDRDSKQGTPEAATFLPKAKESESAPANQRLLYIYPLCSPTRWELEAELAARWVSLGGLRSALEIYQRLEMWAEVALCWAATDREDKARKVIRKQLFHATNQHEQNVDDDLEAWTGPAREPPPTDAPRLYCLLGDIDKDPDMYEKAWEVSNEHYARAQRSLGKLFYGQGDYAKASLSFSKALKVKQLDHATWFALGCALLELEQFKRAVEAFSRAVQLDDQDAEAWSNLAVALLNLETPNAIAPGLDQPAENSAGKEADDLQQDSYKSDPQQHRRDALKALKYAARLKHESHRIWDNILTVATSIHPPSWSDIVIAQKRLIELRGSADGEKTVDVKILSALVNHVISTSTVEDLEKPGLGKMVVQLVSRDVVPLVTAKAELWYLVARLEVFKGHLGSALAMREKAWRAVMIQPGWESGTEAQWNGVVDATVDLVDAYASLGPRERTEGLGAGEGTVVMKDWKFKARSAVRGIMARGKDSWEDTEGWGRLKETMDGLKAS